ncbi:hypothetical protein I317_05058 [Kwoniella heveanensis CBS 569]|uniref:Uncharacterized protein n=1 Tax=Kwoniella heveanensis BCC8398 TaxID=1296120 RepID=A0A1B9GIN0_9TREE|nr:hypothetical protein I316_07486 [Kwoniella heveanensis BCC8398]OCF41144.1 hypothetical protein I317_05058 [Kwoniella heveanensis CBS 569]
MTSEAFGSSGQPLQESDAHTVGTSAEDGSSTAVPLDLVVPRADDHASFGNVETAVPLAAMNEGGEEYARAQVNGLFALDDSAAGWGSINQQPDGYESFLNFAQFPDDIMLSSSNDVWDLLAQDLLPNSRSLHASPQFLAELGLEQDPIFQKAPPASHGIQMDSNPVHTDTPDSTATSNHFLDRRDYEGPVLAAEGLEAAARGDFALSVANAMASRMVHRYHSLS